MRTVAILSLWAALGSAACNQQAAQHNGGQRSTSATTAKSTATAPIKYPEVVRSRIVSKGRVVALGDVHGDMNATLRALKLAGVIDEGKAWTGGQTVLVQTGDILDRGNDEQAIIDLFQRLKIEAKDAGGAVHVLSGNHELMNVAGDFRYVTPGGFIDFEDGEPGAQASAAPDPLMTRIPAPQRARFAAFRPGGAYAKKIASQPVALVVDDTVFAHGGVLPQHVRYGIDRMNDEVARWVGGHDPAGRRIVAAQNSPVWSRHFSNQPDAKDCALLRKTLKALGVKRMVVGHTVQRTIRPACEQRVWRIDVGMAAHYGGQPEVLEIQAGAPRPLRPSP